MSTNYGGQSGGYRDNTNGNDWRGNGGFGSSDRNGFGNGSARGVRGGSGRGRGGRGGRGNPIGNWINRRRRRNEGSGGRGGSGGRNEDGEGDGSSHTPVGTERKAIQNMKRNAAQFNYPEGGFVTPIEHSLLYAMIEFPENYPESVVRQEIEDEDFKVYLYVNDPKAKRRETSNATNDTDDNTPADGSDHDQPVEQPTSSASTATSTPQTAQLEEPAVSYAQLSALLALSAEKNPSQGTAEPPNTQSSTHGNNSTHSTHSSRLSHGTSNSATHPSNPTNNPTNSTNTTNNNNPDSNPNAPLSIGQTLCRKLLKTITHYSDTHTPPLDRTTEIREFLSPIEKQCAIKNEKMALQQLLPAYVGYTLSLVTGNPLPLLVGAVSLMNSEDRMAEENVNVSGFRGMGGRSGDLERAGLLDECEWDDD